MGTSSTDCILEVTDHIVISENCESMKSYLLLFVIWLAMLRNTSTAATNHHTKDASNRVIELKGIIEKGKFEKDATDRELYQYWGDFRDQEKIFNENFDRWICTVNETELTAIHSEMDRLVQKALGALDSKQMQLKELHSILHHENYTETALAKGKDNITEECEALDKYITKANQTAQEEKKELDVHELDVIVYKEKIDNYTCPCLWATWSEWSACSKTCEAGTKSRTRNVETNVRNVPCIGGSSANVTCNDVCCPVDCDWGAWEAWSACPSGCPLGGGLQNKTRTRTKSVEAFCNGNDCQGEVFEKEPCSREEEVVKEHSVVLKECDQYKLEKNQCMSQKNQLAIDLEECKKRSEKSEEKVPDQCRTYMNFTTNRLYTNKVKSYHCDKEGAWKPSPDWRGPGWYRYVGGEEKRMALRHEVTQPYQCGTSYGGYLEDSQSIPDVWGQTKIATVKFYNLENYDEYDRHINITNCGTFNVYQLPDVEYCALGYCFA